MSTRSRKVLVASVVLAILVLANTETIVGWLRDLGIIPFAQHIQSEYVTGAAIAVIVALLVLAPGRAVWAVGGRRCPVCDSLLLRQGRYCAECGSRV